MSRIGKQAIEIPQGVTVEIEGQVVTVKGPKGELQREVRPEMKIEQSEQSLAVLPVGDAEAKEIKSLWGLTRSLIANMIQGVTQGYEKKLVLEGVGYRAALEGNDLVLNVGFSHPVRVSAPDGVSFSVDKNVITVSGRSKELVGEYAARVRKVRPVEPYKGKGIKYAGEVIRRKAGKAATGAKAG